MILISIAHHGIVVDNIRFDSCRTTIIRSASCFSAAPNMSCDVGRSLFADTIRIIFVMYTRMASIILNDFHKIWKFCGGGIEKNEWTWKTMKQTFMLKKLSEIAAQVVVWFLLRCRNHIVLTVQCSTRMAKGATFQTT